MILEKPTKMSIPKLLKKKKILRFPGAYNAVTAQIIEKLGYEGVFISGSGLASSFAGYPDIGLLTETEVVMLARGISNSVGIPCLTDAETGFGSALNIMRTVKEFERAGLSAIQIEDQTLPKKCGHLSGKKLCTTEEMIARVTAAKEAKQSKDFQIVARTDARSSEGLDVAIARARDYQRAGADIIFPEALTSLEEFSETARKLKIPILANMTEFGKTPYLTVEQFKKAGVRIVLYPVTALKISMKATHNALKELKNKGTQKSLLRKMMTRKEWYNIINYAEYDKTDRRISRSNL